MSSAFTQFFNTMGRTVVGSQLEADNASYRELWKGVRMNRWKQLTLGRRLVDDELKSVGTLRLKFRMNKEQGVFCDQGPGCLHSEWSHPIYCVCIHGASGCVWGGGGGLETEADWREDSLHLIKSAALSLALADCCTSTSCITSFQKTWEIWYLRGNNQM